MGCGVNRGTGECAQGRNRVRGTWALTARALESTRSAMADFVRTTPRRWNISGVPPFCDLRVEMIPSLLLMHHKKANKHQR